MPNVNDPNAVWQWIKDDHGTIYDTFWMEKALTLADIDHQRFSMERFTEAMNQVGVHFGQSSGGAYMSVSSLKWALEEACKND